MFIPRKGPWLAALSLLAVSIHAQTDPIDRWANAAGGREKLATITSTYREATLEFRGMQGTAKVWRTPDGRYRKEEQIGPFSIVEIFDGTNATLKQGDAEPRALTGPELARVRGTAFANAVPRTRARSGPVSARGSASPCFSVAFVPSKISTIENGPICSSLR